MHLGGLCYSDETGLDKSWLWLLSFLHVEKAHAFIYLSVSMWPSWVEKLQRIQSHLLIIKAVEYRGLEMNKHTTVYTEQDTQLLGLQMLRPNQVHWQHGSFGLCRSKSLFPYRSQISLQLHVHKPWGSPQTLLVVHTCNIQVHLGRLWGYFSSSLTCCFHWHLCRMVLAVFSTHSKQGCFAIS